MPDTITMNTGKDELISDSEDFESVIQIYLGDDSAEWYENQIMTLTSCIERLLACVNLDEDIESDSDILEDVKGVILSYGLE